jgi:hypothetical protein
VGAWKLEFQLGDPSQFVETDRFRTHVGDKASSVNFFLCVGTISALRARTSPFADASALLRAKCREKGDEVTPAFDGVA